MKIVTIFVFLFLYSLTYATDYSPKHPGQMPGVSWPDDPVIDPPRPSGYPSPEPPCEPYPPDQEPLAPIYNPPACNCSEILLELAKLRESLKRIKEENVSSWDRCETSITKLEAIFSAYNKNKNTNLTPDGTQTPWITLFKEGHLSMIPFWWKTVRSTKNGKLLCNPGSEP